MDTQKKITDFIRKTYRIAEDDKRFTTSVHLFETNLLDSFAINGLIEFLEGEFKIKIEDADFFRGALDTVESMTALVESKLNPEE